MLNSVEHEKRFINSGPGLAITSYLIVLPEAIFITKKRKRRGREKGVGKARPQGCTSLHSATA